MEKLKVLIVDDNKNNLVTLNALLQDNLSVDVVECQSGLTALDLLIQESVDLCILDVQMPDIDGFELAKLIRSRKKTAHIPIILLTAAYLSDKYKQKGFEIGAEDYITKPIDDKLLINRLKAYLRPIEKERAFARELEKKVVERTLELQKEIEERKKIQEELVIAKEKAEQQAKDKSMFLSTMSHEIRTPMNGVLAILRLLLDDRPKAEHVESLRIMKFSADNMMSIINDILDLNKLEANKMELENIDFNLLELISSIKFSMNVKALEKNIDVVSKIDPKIPKIIKGDPVRLGQILNNLVSNAVKFTEKGSVTIKIDHISETEKQCRLKFSVIDTGIGIAKEKIDKLFSPFTQASEDTARKYGGTGLGLSISKNIMDLMKSKIEIESELGKGTTFYFEIDIEKSQVSNLNVEENTSNSETLKGLKVLVAEDNKVNQMVANKFLKKWEAEPDFAENGLIALEKIKNNKTYDLILMDINMPEMGGYEASREIRKLDGDYYKNIPIIALSAATLSEVENEIKDNGMNSAIAKPFKPEDFYNELKKVLNNKKVSI
ncbi:MAG: response regulator [Candidatus Sericytochromatia bacterium]